MQKRPDIERLIEAIKPEDFESFARRFHATELRRWRERLPDPASLPWISVAVYATLATALFAYGVYSKPSFGFDSDDLMNLHEAYVAKPLALLRALAVPFTSFNRPMGALYYRLCFDAFGWNPAAFRTVTYLLMFANMGLVWLLARRLTGSVEIGGAAALLYSFHGRLLWIYDSNGTVYDVLCAFFLLLTLCYYIGVRGRKLPWTWGRVAILLALYISALNAKEMAGIAPALLLVYELCAEDRAEGGRNYRIAILLGALTLAAIWGKTQAGGPFHGESMYTPAFTLKRFFQNAREWQSELFYLRPRDLSTRQVMAIWGAMSVLPCFAPVRYRRALWFSAAFAILGPLPVAFLLSRGFYVMYVPMIGWAVYFAVLAVIARDWIACEARRRAPMSPRQWIVARALLAICLAWVVARGLKDIDYLTVHYDPMRKVIAETKKDFDSLGGALPANGRILLLHSRFPDDAWGPLMIARLLRRNPTLWLDRPTVHLLPGTPDPASYDAVLDFDGKRMKAVK